MKIRYKLLLLTMIVALMSSFPASASSQVDVTLVVSNLSYQLQEARCTVRVASGANALAVLDSAKASGCIQSYTAIYYPQYQESFVDCINGRCTENVPPFRAWTMRENCVTTNYGALGFSAAQGDELSFTYETIVTFFAPTIC